MAIKFITLLTTGGYIKYKLQRDGHRYQQFFNKEYNYPLSNWDGRLGRNWHTKCARESPRFIWQYFSPTLLFFSFQSTVKVIILRNVNIWYATLVSQSLTPVRKDNCKQTKVRNLIAANKTQLLLRLLRRVRGKLKSVFWLRTKVLYARIPCCHWRQCS